LVRFGAACLIVMVSSLSMVLVVLRGALLPMALTLGSHCSPVHPTRVRRPPQLRGVGPRYRQPTAPEHRERRMGRWVHIDASSAPCDHEAEDTTPSHGRDDGRAPQLTHTNPSRTVYPRQPGAPAGPGRSRLLSHRLM
jgi:hypothetical protein